VPPLAPGESHTVTCSAIDLPAETDPGHYALLAVADSSDVLAEVSETNNMRDTRIILQSCGAIAGTVTNSATGEPIAGADVMLDRYAYIASGDGGHGCVATYSGGGGGTVTWPDGTYYHPRIATGEDYTLAAASPGFARESVTPVVVLPGQTTTVDVTLAPLPETVIASWESAPGSFRAVSVNSTDGSCWADGADIVHFDSEGLELCTTGFGGYWPAVDSGDGTCWIARRPCLLDGMHTGLVHAQQRLRRSHGGER